MAAGAKETADAEETTDAEMVAEADEADEAEETADAEKTDYQTTAGTIIRMLLMMMLNVFC